LRQNHCIIRAILTLINTFTVEPERAQSLLAHLSKATEDIFLHLPGFVSANFHVSRDRRHVANYAQWCSQENYDAMVKNPRAQVHMRDAAAIASAFNPILYDLVETHVAEPAA
jgi:quinol monooxygenase YgiN